MKRIWLWAGLTGGVLEIACSLPSYLIYVVPRTLTPIVDAVSVVCGFLYFFLWPGVGLLTGLLLPRNTPTRTAVNQAAAAGFTASILDHIATIGVRVWLMQNGYMPAQAAGSQGNVTFQSEFTATLDVGILVLAIGTTLSVIACLVTMQSTRKLDTPQPAGKELKTPSPAELMAEVSLTDFDLQIRYLVYRFFADHCRAPGFQEIAALACASEEAVLQSFQKLHVRHMLFLDVRTNTIRIANPFSGVATSYKVKSGDKTWWANCAWDMLGIPAALNIDADLQADYPDIIKTVTFQVRNGTVDGRGHWIYFPLPCRYWYDDLVYT